MRPCSLLRWLLAILLVASAIGAKPLKRERPLRDAYDDPLPSGAIARIGTVRLRHGHAIIHVAFSRDGKWVISSSGDGTIRIWNPASGREVRCLAGYPAGHPDQAGPFSLSPDGKSLASISQNRELRFWSLDSGDTIWKLETAGSSYGICFSPDGRTLASCGRHIELWDTATQKLVREFGKMVPSSILCIAFAPDGKTLVAGDHEGVIHFWDPETGKEVRRILAHKGSVHTLVFASRGNLLASAGIDGAACLWRIASGKQIRSFTASKKICCALAFTPRGDGLATSWEGGTIRLFEVATGKELRRYQSNHVAEAESLAFAPDGKMLASGGSDSTVRLWSMATHKELFRSTGPQGPMCKVALSPNGRLLACAGKDDHVYFQDISTAVCYALPGQGRWRAPLAFSADGQALVAEGPDRTLNVWDVVTRAVRHRFRWKDAKWLPLALSPDGRLVALQEGGKTLHLMEVATGKERCAIRGSPFELAFSVDRQLLAWGNREGDVRLYGVATGNEQRQFRWPLRQFNSLALSHDNQLLAVAEHAGNHYEIRVALVATGEEVLRLQVGWRYAWALAFAPDGRTLAAGLDDHTIGLWEVPSGGSRGVIRGHRGIVDSVVFSRDCRRLASASRDTTALLWDLAALPGGRSRPAGLANPRLEQLWRELAGEDAAVAYRAIWELVAFPKSASAYLGSRLCPVPRITLARLARLLADLDSTDFDVRQEARATLVKLEDAAEPALLKAARRPPSAEVGRQVKELLDQLRTARRATSGDHLRARRAVEALERMNTPEARRLLEKLAAGAPGAGLTQDAKASLLRMRPARSPSP